MPKSSPTIRKRYFVADTPEGHNSAFKRHAYKLLDSTSLSTLVHYLGDDSVGSQHPHDNSKSFKPFIRTCPSVISSVSAIQEKPSNVYKKMVHSSLCTPEQQPVLVPCNIKQIKNLQHKERQSTRLTHDAIYNLHELAYDLGDFVYKVITFPNLLMVCGLKA